MALPVVAVVGPTAVGKSELALDLAQRLRGEIVNTDAMQLYRGMDIGTAKLPVAERRGIPHHLLDVLEVTETATVAEFQTWARAAIRTAGTGRGPGPRRRLGALHPRGAGPFEFPGTDPEVRARLEAELAAPGRPLCTTGSPISIRKPPPGSFRRTDGGSSGRSR